MASSEGEKLKAILLNELEHPPTITEEYHCTDLGNAKRIRDTYGEEIRYCHPMKSWLVWDGSRWAVDRKSYLYEVCARGVIAQLYDEALKISDFEKKKTRLKYALSCESNHCVNNMVELAKSEPGITILPDILDEDSMLFNVQNGTIDLRTGKLKPHSKTDFITKVSPVTYDEKAVCPTWLSFLDKIFAGNKNIIEYLQRKNGYILTGDTREEEFDQYFGTGGNGKSKYVNEIFYIMGEYAQKVNVETIQAASDSRSGNAASSDVACLRGARFVVVSEPEKGTVLNEARIKEWTGRDRVKARFLYQEAITFTPEFKFVIYTNWKLRIRGTDQGIWRRLKLVPFLVSIPEEEQDKELDKKLLKESSGILNWMIEGCMKWQKDGLKVPSEILEATQEYREDQDYLGEFFKLCCDVGKGLKCRSSDIYLVYQAYCAVQDIQHQNNRNFSETLESKKFKKDHDVKGNFFWGIGLKPFIQIKFENMKSEAAEGKAEGLKDMKAFLETFLRNSYAGNFTEMPSNPSEPSAIQPTHSETPIGTKNKPECTTLQPLTNQILEAKAVFSKQFGEIDNTNIIKFSMWACERYKFKWNSNGESGEYTPSAIKGIASKLFALTPGGDSHAV